MNALRAEIRKAMFALTEEPGAELSAKFIFPLSFLGFKGHFESKPVLPGVCKIQAALVMLEAWKKKRVELKEIILAKFYHPASFGQELFFKVLEIVDSPNVATIKVLVTKEKEKIAQLKLKIAYCDD